MVERFHVGQRARLKDTLETKPPGLFPRGAMGTVTNVGGGGEIEGEIAVWVRMDQHFTPLDHWDNQLLVKWSQIEPRIRWARLRAVWRGSRAGVCGC